MRQPKHISVKETPSTSSAAESKRKNIKRAVEIAHKVRENSNRWKSR